MKIGGSHLEKPEASRPSVKVEVNNEGIEKRVVRCVWDVICVVIERKLMNLCLVEEDLMPFNLWETNDRLSVRLEDELWVRAIDEGHRLKDPWAAMTNVVWIHDAVVGEWFKKISSEACSLRNFQ